LRLIPKTAVFAAGIVGLVVGLIYGSSLYNRYNHFADVMFGELILVLFLTVLLWPILVFILFVITLMVG